MSDSDSDGNYGPVLPPLMRTTSSERQKKQKGPPKASTSSDDDDCMPALPPAMHAVKTAETRSYHTTEGASGQIIGPVLLPSLIGAAEDNHDVRPPASKSSKQEPPKSPQQSPIIGPINPASLSRNNVLQDRDETVASSDDDTYGPALPPSFTKRPAAAPPPRVKGPTLPPGGLPPEEEDDDVIGPLPPKDWVDLGGYASADVERRADAMKQKLDEASRPEKHTREEWMLSLPPERAGEFGLGPRQFRRTTPAERGDTSGWTKVGGAEAAASKPKRKQEPEVDLAVQRRDKMMADVADKLKKDRNLSLLEMHQKKSKRAKKNADSPPRKRQEFDREKDMATNKFDDAQRKAAIKRSRGAADMFGSGSQKYL